MAISEDLSPHRDETLIGNTTFEVDTEPWEVEAPAKIRWQNAASETPTGVLVITRCGPAPGERPSMLGSFQCIVQAAQAAAAEVLFDNVLVVRR